MEKIINFLYDFSAYAEAIPIIVGGFFWKKLNIALKIYLIGLLIFFSISMVSQVLAGKHQNTHFLFYFLCIATVFVYALFYQKLIKFNHANLIFWLIPIGFLVYLSIDFLKNGVQLFFTMPFLVIDFLVLPCSIFLFQKSPNNQEILVLNLGILINTCFDIPFTICSNYLFRYFQGKVFQTIFFGISPLFNILFVAFQLYAFYLVGKQIAPNFDKTADFQ